MIASRRSPAPGFAFESEILIEAARLGFSTVAVDIPTIYGSVLRRPSHFRPVADITRIVLMVAGKLLARGMDPVACGGRSRWSGSARYYAMPPLIEMVWPVM